MCGYTLHSFTDNFTCSIFVGLSTQLKSFGVIYCVACTISRNVVDDLYVVIHWLWSAYTQSGRDQGPTSVVFYLIIKTLYTTILTKCRIML